MRIKWMIHSRPRAHGQCCEDDACLRRRDTCWGLCRHGESGQGTQRRAAGLSGPPTETSPTSLGMLRLGLHVPMGQPFPSRALGVALYAAGQRLWFFHLPWALREPLGA